VSPDQNVASVPVLFCPEELLDETESRCSYFEYVMNKLVGSQSKLIRPGRMPLLNDRMQLPQRQILGRAVPTDHCGRSSGTYSAR
jgi:hypothetical protein